MRNGIYAAGLLSLLALATPGIAGATGAGEQVLYRFAGGTDGAGPASALIADSQGNLYGTTSAGGGTGCGGAGCGTVFELSPGNGGWTETVLHAFADGTDGANPAGALVADSAGNLYGATSTGGESRGCTNCGTVFELSPGNGGWTETVIYIFDGHLQKKAYGDLETPSGVALGADGNVYGFAAGHCKEHGKFVRCSGGAFELTSENGVWSETTIAPGYYQYGSPLPDSRGNLYGFSGVNFGDVLELQPPAGQGGWTVSDVYNFQAGNDGAIPVDRLAMDGAGNLYGATLGWDEFASPGTVFQLTPAKKKGMWKETTLYPFANASGGTLPGAGPVLGTDGNLYGTTREGGQNGFGVVYGLSPHKGGWTESVLYSFAGGSDGADPQSAVLVNNGALYGTTSSGGGTGCGGNGCGTVFAVVP